MLALLADFLIIDNEWEGKWPSPDSKPTTGAYEAYDCSLAYALEDCAMRRRSYAASEERTKSGTSSRSLLGCVTLGLSYCLVV